MELLKASFFFGLLFLVSGCGQTTTVIDYIETDTYISSADMTNHSDLQTLNISNASGTQEHVIFKLPTGAGTASDSLSDIFSQTATDLVLTPFFLLEDILAAIFGCQDTVLFSDQLTSAQLVFNVSDSGGQSLTGAISLEVLSAPWWQNTDWYHAHFFSSKGMWATPGGDVDPTVAPIAATASGSTITFDVTSYLQSLIASSSPIHYGMMLVPATTLQPVTLLSAQSSLSGQGPRVISTYTCTANNNLNEKGPAAPHVYYLGSLKGKKLPLQ